MSQYIIDFRETTSQFLYLTVRIEMSYADGAVGSGTGFFDDFYDYHDRRPYLVTNRHVIEDAASLRIRLHAGTKNSPEPSYPLDGFWFEMTEPEKFWTPHPDSDVDLRTISVNRLTQLGMNPEFFSRALETRSIPPLEESRRYPALTGVLMIGYPIGLWDAANNLPILRRGTTASHPAIDFNDRPDFVVDIACFPGSSGSPVLAHDRDYFAGAVRLLGVLYAGPVTSLTGELVVHHIPTLGGNVMVDTMVHLGYVVKAHKVQELVRHAAEVEATT